MGDEVMMRSADRTELSRSVLSLLTVLFLSASVLSVKCTVDLIGFSEQFPWWFVPLFGLGMLVLIGLGSTMLSLTWKARDSIRWASGAGAALIWVLIPLSFICTSAVHSFYPFRPSPDVHFADLDSVLQFNLILTAAGFAVSAVCGVLYGLGRRHLALGLLLFMALFLLIPNDACRNPFNEWWLATVGASPLMFVPNLYAIVFGTAALVGVYRLFNTLMLSAVGGAVVLLGLGHMFRVIW